MVQKRAINMLTIKQMFILLKSVYSNDIVLLTSSEMCKLSL